jgi:hypothetical protein
MARRDFLRGATDASGPRHPERKVLGSVYASELGRAYVHIRIGARAVGSYSDAFTSEAAVAWIFIVLARAAVVDVIDVQRGFWQ